MKQDALHPSDFYFEMAKARAWVLLNKNIHVVCISILAAVALAVLQFALSVIFPEMGIMWVGYFSFAMNTVLLVLFVLCAIGGAGLYFGKQFKVEFGGEKPQLLLDPGTINIAPDIAIMSISSDEAAESFKARVDAAFDLAEGQTWVLVIAFRHYSFQIRMLNDIGEKPETGYFLRSQPFMEGKPELNDVADSIHKYSNESFESYVAYCRALAAEFKVWSATEKIGRTNPFTNAAEWLRTQAVFPILFLFVSLPQFVSAQSKTAQVEKYMGERATIAAPTKGKVVDYIFERREISVIAQGKNYLETLQDVPFFQNANDAGKLLLIKVGGAKILPKSPPLQERLEAEVSQPESAVPIPEGTPGENFIDRLPDSSELEVMKATHLKSKSLEWRKIEPVIDFYMWRFWGLMIIVFGVGGILWVLARVSAKDSLKDLYGNAFLGNAITQMHIFSKTFLFGIMAIPTVVILMDDCIRAYYTSVFGFWFVMKYAAIYFLWQWVFEKVLPDSPGTRSGGDGAYPVNNHRRLNG